MAQRLAMVEDKVAPEVVTVTPGVAKRWLLQNQKNRHIRPTYVEQLKRSLVRGQWTASTDAIGFDESGRLVNGQHRLTAIAESGISADLLVVHDLPPNARLNLDVGAKRSFADFLTLEREEVNTAVLAAIVAFTMQFSDKGFRVGWRTNVSISELLAKFDSNADSYRAAANITGHRWRTALLPPSALGGLYVVFAELNEEDSCAFIDAFVSGQGLNQGNPILTLRNQLIGRTRSRSYAVPMRIAVAWAIRAWNSYRRGEERQVLRWGAGDPYPIPE